MSASHVRRVSTTSSMVETSTAIRVPDRYEIDARSRLEARAKLQQYRGVMLGAPYRDQLDQTPDARVVYQSISIAPKGSEGAEGTTRLYVADCEAGFDAQTFGPPDRPPLEVNGRAEFTIESVEREEPIEIDIDGNLIANSAGVPFDPSETVLRPGRFYRLVWLASGEEIGDADRRLRVLEGHVNAGEFMGAAPRELLIHQAVPSIVGVGTGVLRYDVRIEYLPQRIVTSGGVQVQVPGGDLVKLDEGFQELNPNFNPADATSDRLVDIEINNEAGDLVPVSHAVPLDGLGARLPPNADPVVRVFKRHPEADFSQLGVQVNGY